MHSTLLVTPPRKQTFASEQHGSLHPRQLREMEAKQHSIKSLKSYPEAGGRSLAAAAGGDVGGGGGSGSGGYRTGSAEMEMETKIQKAIEFKVEGHRCYKEKKFREAIGKYHRALLHLKGVHVIDGTTGSEVNLLNQATAKLTEEQRRAVEITEIECYDSLTGERRRLCGGVVKSPFHTRSLSADRQSKVFEPGKLVLTQSCFLLLFVPVHWVRLTKMAFHVTV